MYHSSRPYTRVHNALSARSSQIRSQEEGPPPRTSMNAPDKPQGVYNLVSLLLTATHGNHASSRHISRYMRPAAALFVLSMDPYINEKIASANRSCGHAGTWIIKDTLRDTISGNSPATSKWPSINTTQASWRIWSTCGSGKSARLESTATKCNEYEPDTGF
jgi:hypothetical protein